MDLDLCRFFSSEHPSFDYFAASNTPDEYNKIRFRILCQNKTMTPLQRMDRNIPQIVFDADELHFDSFMTNLRVTSKTICDQCGFSPSGYLHDPILDYYDALKEVFTCNHTICIFCLRKKFRNVTSTTRCTTCSIIWFVNSESTYQDKIEYNEQIVKDVF
jgi:hypothetical protein